ncbi:class I SAM-dependent methyltransferase, partial [Bacillus pseudomycoides]
MYTYYSNRAKEYETVYDRDDAVRQAEQFILQQKLKELFREKEILEVACGTGYWTQYVVEVAAYITAIDYSEEVLDVEKAKELPKERVSFH